MSNKLDKLCLLLLANPASLGLKDWIKLVTFFENVEGRHLDLWPILFNLRKFCVASSVDSLRISCILVVRRTNFNCRSWLESLTHKSLKLSLNITVFSFVIRLARARIRLINVGIKAKCVCPC